MDAVAHACRWAVALLFLQSYDALTANLNTGRLRRGVLLAGIPQRCERQERDKDTRSGRSSCIAVDVHAAAWYAAGLLAKADNCSACMLKCAVRALEACC
jgi:hypothetical protein